MSRFNFLEKDIVHADGELTKEQASKIKLSLKPKRIRNRFKNRFLMKPIFADGEIITHYRKDCTAHDFRSNVVAVLARFEAEKNEKRKTHARF